MPQAHLLRLQVLPFQVLLSSPARLLPEFFPQQLPLLPVLLSEPLSGFLPEQLLSHPARLPESHPQPPLFHPEPWRIPPELLWSHLPHLLSRPVLPWFRLQPAPWSQPGSRSLTVLWSHLRQAH